MNSEDDEMDSLMNLCGAIQADPQAVAAASSSEPQSALAVVETGARSRQPRFARSRSSRFLLAGSSAKADTSAETAESGANKPTGNLEVVGTEEGAKRKPCPGCFRIYGVSKSFYNPVELVQWSDKNGSSPWCMDCHHTWRTGFSSTHPLSLLPSWLVLSHDNDVSWTLHLLAMVMLRFENGEAYSVRAPTLAARVESVRFMLQLLRVPIGRFYVVPLTTFFSGDTFAAERSSVTSQNLVSMQSERGRHLGVWVANKTPRNVTLPGAVERPGIARGTYFDNLQTDFKDDLELLVNHFGAEQVAVKAIEDGSLDAAPKKSEVKCKYRLRYTIIVDKVLAPCQKLTTPEWSDLKESSLTTPLGKLTTFEAEARSEGKKEVAKEAKAVVDTCTGVKKFLGLYRNYNKGRKTAERMLPFARACFPLQKQLREVLQLTLAPSLDLLFHKMKFTLATASREEDGEKDWAGVERATSFQSLARSLVQDGLCASMEKQHVVNSDVAVTETHKVALDAWLQPIITKGMQDAFVLQSKGILPECKDDARFEHAAEKVLADVTEAKELIHKVPVQDDADLVKLRRSLDSLHLLVKCSVSPSEMQQASALSEAVREWSEGCDNSLVDLLDSLCEDRLFEWILARGHAKVARGATDDLGLLKVNQAAKFLRESRLAFTLELPRVDDSDKRVLIMDYGIVSAARTIQVVQESIDSLSEAFGMMSPIATEKAASDIKAAVTLVQAQLKVNDVVCTVDVQRKCRDTQWLFAELGGAGADGMAVVPMPSASVPFMEESLAGQTLATLLRLEETKPTAVCAFPGLRETVQLQLQPSMEVRNKIKAFVRAVGVSPTRPPTARHMVDNFLLPKDNPGAGQMLQQRCEIVHAAQSLLDAVDTYREAWSASTALEPHAGAYAFYDGELRAPEVFDQDLDFFDVAPLALFSERVAATHWCSDAQADLVDCVSLVCKDIGVAIELHGIKMKEDSALVSILKDGQHPPEGGHVLRSLVDVEKVPMTLESASRYFQSLDGSWPILALLEMLHEMLNAMDSAARDQTYSIRAFALAPELVTEADKTDAEGLCCLADVCVKINTVMMSCAYLRRSAESKNEDIIVKGNLGSDILRAIDELSLHAPELLRELESIELNELANKHKALSWLLSLLGWAQRVVEGSYFVKLHYHGILTGAMQALASDLMGRRPSIETFVNDTIYQKALVNRHLLKWHGRTDYSRDSVQLHALITNVRKLYKAFGIKPNLEQNKEMTSKISEATTVFDATKKVVRVIAITSAIQEKTGDERKEAINKLSANTEGVPKALVAALEKEKDQQPVAKKRKVT